MNSYQKRLSYPDRVALQVEWGHWFIFFNVFISIATAVRYVLNSPINPTTVSLIYETVSVIGHFWFVNFVIFLLCLFPLAFIIPKERVFKVLATAVMILSQSVLLIDTQIFHKFHFHLNLQLIQIFTDNSNYHSGMNFNFLLIVIPLLIGIEIILACYASYKAEKHRTNWIARSFVIFFVCCFAATHLLHIWADYAEYEPITDQEATLPLSYPMTAKSFLNKNDWLILPQPDKITEYNYLNYPLSPIKFNPNNAKDPSYLLITVKDLSYEAADENSMPYLASIRGEALDFTEHYANDTDTGNSCFSLFYGLSPQYRRHFTRSQVTPLLIDELQRHSYTINRIISSSGGKPEETVVFTGLRTKNGGYEKSDDAAVSSATAYIAANWNRNTKNAMYVSLEAPALVFKSGGSKGEISQRILKHYTAALKKTDAGIKKIVEALRQTGEDQNTVVIITGLTGKSLTQDQQEPDSLSYESLHVPLLVIHPGYKADKISYLTSHTDVAPTLLVTDLGVTSSISDFSNGYSLFGQDRDSFILAGNNRKVGIIEADQITLFSKKGTYMVTDSKKGDKATESSITMQTLVRVTRQLHKFFRN